jgi:hypothetical protein
MRNEYLKKNTISRLAKIAEQRSIAIAWPWSTIEGDYSSTVR